MTACLFCGSEGKLSREHVAPQWIGKLFPELSDVEYERVFQAAGEPIETHRRPGVGLDQTVKNFCVVCNNGWMAQLEDEVKPILGPLIQDEPGPLDALAQERIAVWAAKTILAIGPTNLGKRAIASLELYRWVGERQIPLPGSIVWLSRYTGTEQWPVSFHHHGMVIARADQPMPPPGSPTNGFHSILAVGSVALCVFLADIKGGPMVEGTSSNRRVKIWPTSGDDVWWPPSEPMTSVAELREESRQSPSGTTEPFSGT